MGDGGGEHWLVWMEWRPAGWSVSASFGLPLQQKVQRFSSGTGSPWWSRKKGHKLVVVVVLLLYYLITQIPIVLGVAQQHLQVSCFAVLCCPFSFQLGKM